MVLRPAASAATSAVRTEAAAYVTNAAWIPAIDQARPPSNGPTVTPTFSNSPNNPITRAWFRRGEDSEIHAVVAGHRSEAPAVRRTAPMTTTPQLPALGYTPQPPAERMPPTI